MSENRYTPAEIAAAKRKLDRLKDQADQLSAASRSAYDRVEEQRAKVDLIGLPQMWPTHRAYLPRIHPNTGALEDLRLDRLGDVLGTTDAGQVRPLQRALDEWIDASRELMRLRKVEAAARERYHDFAAVIRPCEEFLKSLPRPAPPAARQADGPGVNSVAGAN